MIERLQADFPQFKWRLGARFRWRPATKTITLENGDADQKYALQALHELAHALLRHQDDTYDLPRLRCEAEAWDKVKRELCGRYDVAWDEDFAQDNLDTYRAWLHKKSACPVCKQCRLQTKDGGYSCLNGCSED